MSTPRADADRIGAFLDELAEIGRHDQGGWSRLAFSPQERMAHALFTDRLGQVGLRTWTDAAGNSYGEVPGDDDRPVLMTGSHLDTVYQGGNFDGAVGVAAAVEAARLVAEGGLLRRPLRVVAFAGEEGARFGVPCIGSRLATGAFDAQTLRSMTDRDGISAYTAARDAGLRPAELSTARWDFDRIAAFIEVHIEQGRVLAERGRTIGIVHSIGGSTRVELVFSGSADHTGATPMWLRRDALVAAAQFVVGVDQRARAHATTVATVGRMDVWPNSLTTVPGRVLLDLDVRDIDSARQRDLAEGLLDDAVRIASGRDIEVNARLLSDQSPVVLHTSIQQLLAGAAEERGIGFITMASGASHDAAHIARHVPTGMVFVPCRNGISHSPAEHAEPEHIAVAVDVMVQALLDRDSSDD